MRIKLWPISMSTYIGAASKSVFVLLNKHRVRLERERAELQQKQAKPAPIKIFRKLYE